MAQVTTAAPFNLRSDARHAAAEEKLAARQADVTAAEKRAASFKVCGCRFALACIQPGTLNIASQLISARDSNETRASHMDAGVAQCSTSFHYVCSLTVYHTAGAPDQASTLPSQTPNSKGDLSVAQARPVASKGAIFVPRLPAKPATQAAGPSLASDARSAARRAFDAELAAKEAQLEVRSIHSAAVVVPRNILGVLRITCTRGINRSPGCQQLAHARLPCPRAAKLCASHTQVEREQAEAERAKREARELRQYRKSLVFKVRIV